MCPQLLHAVLMSMKTLARFAGATGVFGHVVLEYWFPFWSWT